MSELDIDPGDRCDVCGAQAYAKAFEKPGGRSLLFCCHHWRKHGLALDARGWRIVDHTDRIEAKR